MKLAAHSRNAKYLDGALRQRKEQQRKEHDGALQKWKKIFLAHSNNDKTRRVGKAVK